MGDYIQGPTLGKAAFLIKEHNAVVIPQPTTLSNIPIDKAVVCVVTNQALFDAAGYCFSDRELEAFSQPHDDRPKVWLMMDKQLARKLSGY